MSTIFSIKKNKLLRVAWQCAFIVMLFLYVYNPQFTFLSGGVTKFVILLVLPFVYIWRIELLRIMLRKEILFFVGGAFFLYLYSLEVTYLTGAFDSTFAPFFREIYLISIPLSLALTYLFARKVECSFDGFLRLFMTVITIQALFIMADRLIPAFREFIPTLVVNNALPDRVLDFRSSGISSGTGDGLSFIQAVGVMIAYYLLITSRVTFLSNLVYGLSFLLCFLSILFTGRTGLFLTVVFVATFIVVNHHSFATLGRTLKYLLLAFFIAIPLYFVTIPENTRSFLETTVFSWSFEFIGNYVDTGTFSTSSSDEVKEMLVLPGNEKELLFGSGYFDNYMTVEEAKYGQPMVIARYMNSDPGYVRTIFYSGIIGLVLILSYYLYVAFCSAKNAIERQKLAFMVSFWVMMFVAHFKVSFLYYGTSTRIMFLFYFILLLEVICRVDSDNKIVSNYLTLKT